MADEWWQNDPIASAPQSGRVGYIPGVPKAKDPLDAEAKALDIESKRLDVAEKQRKAASPNAGADKLTEGELKGGAFVKRALGAFKNYEQTGVGPRGIINNTVNEISPNLANNLPGWAGGNDVSRQQASTAENEFLTAILRQDSGATITPQELESQRQIYFPQPGETAPEIIAAKREARLRALQGLMGAAGRSVDPDTAAAIQGLSGAPQQLSETPNGTHIYDDSQNRGGIGLSQSGGVAGQAGGGTHTETNPALQGINGQVNEMLKGGASDKEIIALLKSRGAKTADLVAVKTQLNDIRKFQKGPGRNYKGDYNIDLERYDAPNSGWQNIASSPVGTAGLTMADTFTGGHIDNVVGALGGDPELANLGIQLSRETNPKAALAGDVAGGAGAYLAGSQALRAAGVAPQAGKISMFAPRAMAGDAALGGYVSSGQGTTDLVDPGNVAKGLLLGVGTGAATRGLLNGAGAAISPTGGDLAPLYEAGVRPTVGQRLGAGNFLGRSLNRAEQAFGSVPVLGGIQRAGRNAAVSEMQTGAFNQALGEIGLQLPKGITKGKQAHAFMQQAFDDIYDRARSGMQFSPDDGFATDISAIADDAGMLFPQSKAIVQKISDDIGSKVASSGGTLSGDQFKVVVSRLGKKIGALRSSPNGDTELADVLDSMKTAIENAARRQSNPEAVALLDAADRGYAKAVIIENAGKARGGEAGEFNGTQLDASVQRTDKSRRSRAYQRGEANMQKYGEAAKKLGDELPDSGTAERVATLATAGGAAHFISPAALLPWAADTAANLPGVRQTLGTLMAPRPQAIREQTDAARHFLEMLARVAPAVSIPVAE